MGTSNFGDEFMPDAVHQITAAKSETLTQTQTTICRLLIFNQKAIRDVETEAAFARIQGEGGAGSDNGRADGGRFGQPFRGSSDDDPQLEISAFIKVLLGIMPN